MRSFHPYDLPPNAEALRREVRAFLAEHNPSRTALAQARNWQNLDPDFSKKMGAAGYIGITFPKQYGGQGKSYAERYVVLEEMLAAGAPVGFHWIADRQSGPLLLRFGTEEQRQRLLPPICRGESSFCIGMSEPGSGSDLASVRSRGVRVDGGWRVTGQKIWTSGAHVANYTIALIRTGEGSQRHAGLSQLMIDLKSEGVTVKPIANVTGESHFNEVFFDDVFVPDNMLVGQEGNGWAQVSAELAYERSGPERYMSSFGIFRAFLRTVEKNPTEAERLVLGRMTAELWTLRQMSLSVTGMLAAGDNPMVDASIVKDLGTSLEQEMPLAIQAVARGGADPSVDGDFGQAVSYTLQSAPSYSLRGGTREILRGIIAKELGLR